MIGTQRRMLGVLNKSTEILCYCLILCYCWIAAAATTTTDIAISAPDIYPTDAHPFVGEVVVKMVSNERNAYIYYTLNGDVPTNASTRYTDPFKILRVGRTTVRAKAISRLSTTLQDSAVVERTYVVEKSDVEPPVFHPPPGHYRGEVHLTFECPQKGAKVQYVDDNENNPWIDFEEGKWHALDHTGRHVVFAHCVLGDKQSPVASYHYDVTPPLLYDVLSNCERCSYKPTVGRIFTVYLQNAIGHSQLFLTTSAKGCEGNKHRIEDTPTLKVYAHQIAYHFVTSVEPQSHVWVCVKEPGETKFKIVPKRVLRASGGGGSGAGGNPHAAENDVYANSFEILQQGGGEAMGGGRHIHYKDKTMDDVIRESEAKSPGAFSFLTFVVIVITLGGLGYFLQKVFKLRRFIGDNDRAAARGTTTGSREMAQRV